MNTFELLAELLKKSDDEINYVILKLMVEGKLDSHKVFNLYMKCIEHNNSDLKDRLTESNTSIIDLIHNLVMPKSKKKSTIDCANKAIHRGLYNLNSSRLFNMQSLNEKYNYNEEEDKKLSWYWRTKNGR